jgi:DNA repair exonuclease SbcCD nuclease subunit
VRIFNNEIQTYEFQEIDIYGYGFDDFYCNNFEIEKINIKNKEKINILIIHGDLDGNANSDMAYNPINKSKLKAIGFDYVALGHIHKAMYNTDDNIAYPGSTIALGFDELGDHGVLDIELNKNKIKINFIKLDNINFEEMELDISEITSFETLIERINKINLEENKLYKIILIGNKNIEININKIINLILSENIVTIKDNSKLNIDIYKLSEENNLKGLFINELLKKEKNKELNEEIIKKAIEIGTEVL